MNRTRDGEFEAYVLARGRALERFAYALTGDAHRAQDLVQNVLLKAYRRWDRITALEHPDAYLRRMLTNGYLDWRRRRGSTELPVDEIPDHEALPDLAVGVVDRDQLTRALRQLSPHQRAVLVLRHIEGQSDEDIATALGCSIGTVRTHATRGRVRLHAALTDPNPAGTTGARTAEPRASGPGTSRAATTKDAR